MPGSWQPLANQPAFNASTMLLLTDGTVMGQESNGTAWWRLTPDEWVTTRTAPGRRWPR